MELLDTCLTAVDRGLRSLAGTALAKRPNPATKQRDELLDDRQRRHAAALMRVNHCGEICAQALYEGQALTAQNDAVRQSLADAAHEEEDHLAWCRERLGELNSRPSRLDPAFYVASFLLGTTTGLLGDRVSLGFVAATEDQVRRHLERHIEALPAGDSKSRAILAAMRDDEVRHGQNAVRAGGAVYPRTVKNVMRWASKLMTATTYRF